MNRVKEKNLLRMILTDSFLKDIPKDRLRKLIDNIRELAPRLVLNNPPVVFSVIRGLALSGEGDSVPVDTALQLSELEKFYKGLEP